LIVPHVMSFFFSQVQFAGLRQILVIVAHHRDKTESFVSMLNDKSVDLEQEPLGDYDKSTTARSVFMTMRRTRATRRSWNR
jgi:hypothetical protein